MCEGERGRGRWAVIGVFVKRGRCVLVDASTTPSVWMGGWVLRGFILSGTRYLSFPRAQQRVNVRDPSLRGNLSSPSARALTPLQDSLPSAFSRRCWCCESLCSHLLTSEWAVRL